MTVSSGGALGDYLEKACPDAPSLARAYAAALDAVGLNHGKGAFHTAGEDSRAKAQGVTCLNTPGTIDSDYRGEVHVLLINLGHDVFEITRGMRIAQIVIAPAVRAAPAETTEPPDATGRGAGGFGSTGTH